MEDETIKIRGLKLDVADRRLIRKKIKQGNGKKEIKLIGGKIEAGFSSLKDRLKTLNMAEISHKIDNDSSNKIIFKSQIEMKSHFTAYKQIYSKTRLINQNKNYNSKYLKIKQKKPKVCLSSYSLNKAKNDSLSCDKNQIKNRKQQYKDRKPDLLHCKNIQMELIELYRNESKMKTKKIKTQNSQERHNTNIYQCKQIDYQGCMEKHYRNRPTVEENKTLNEQIIGNIDVLNRAISQSQTYHKDRREKRSKIKISQLMKKIQQQKQRKNKELSTITQIHNQHLNKLLPSKKNIHIYSQYMKLNKKQRNKFRQTLSLIQKRNPYYF